jgi:hypothetical protein
LNDSEEGEEDEENLNKNGIKILKSRKAEKLLFGNSKIIIIPLNNEIIFPNSLAFIRCGLFQ